MAHVKSDFHVEIDIYIPDFKLAFEYHGMQHYKQFFMDNIEEQKVDFPQFVCSWIKRRDEYRRVMCKHLGITLIEIPYWWDKNEGSCIVKCNEM